MQQLNPFDNPVQDCYVVQNPQHQFTLWPSFNAVPSGWQAVFGPQPQSACIAWLNDNWRDIRPTVAATERGEHV